MNSISIAQRMGIADENQESTAGQEQIGIDLHIEFKPTDKVWYLTEKGIESAEVVKVITTHRSAISSRYVEIRTVTYLLSNSLERSDKEVFGSKEALIASLSNK